MEGRNRYNNILTAKWIILIPFCLYLILSIGRVLTNMPWCDESWFASSAVNLVRDGFMGNTNFIGVGTPWETLAKYTYWQPPVYFLTQALTFKLFGIGIAQVRSISVFWGFMGLIAVYYLAKEVFSNNQKLIFLSLLLIGTANFYISAASDGRMDMMAATLSLIGFTLYINLRERNFNLSVLLGNVFVCLSGLTHPNGILGLLVLLFLIIYLDKNKITFKSIMMGLIPYILGAVGWGLYIFQDLEAFKSQFLANVLRPGDKEYVTGFKWGAIYSEIINRYLYSFGFLHKTSPQLGLLSYSGVPVLLIFFSGLICGPFLMKEKKVKILWYMLLLYFLGFMFLIGNKTAAYLVWIVPLFLLNLVGVFSVIFKDSNFYSLKRSLKIFKWNNLLYIFFLLSFVYTVLYAMGYTGYLVNKNFYYKQYLCDLTVFNDKYYDGGKIYGSGELTFFYNFNDNIIQDDVRMGYYTGIKPDYFVVEIRYNNWFERFKKQEPLVYDYITRNLSTEYTEVYKGKFYTFYKRSLNT